MAYLAELSDADRETLKKILRTLGLKQRDLTVALGINQSRFSQILKGTIESTSPEMLREIAEFLINRAKIFQANANLPIEEIPEIVEFLSRFSNSAEDLVPKKVFPSGGIVPVDAANYVER